MTQIELLVDRLYGFFLSLPLLAVYFIVGGVLFVGFLIYGWVRHR